MRRVESQSRTPLSEGGAFIQISTPPPGGKGRFVTPPAQGTAL